MNRQSPNRVIRWAAMLALLLAPQFAFAQDAEKQPNFLFVFADDLAFNAVRYAGNEEVKTPNLDRLATSGVVFTHCYNQGSWSGAVCVASRHMLNTGRFLWHAEAASQQAEVERKEGRFWSEYMKSAGYDTYMTGKWHVRADPTKAFDVTAHIRAGMPKDTKVGYNRPIEGEADPWSPVDTKFGGYWEGGKHWSEVVADDALDFIQQSQSSDDPFFMYIAFNAPHDPRQSPQSFVDMYPLENISLPTNFIPMYPYKDAIGCGENLRDERLAPFPRTEYAVKVNRQEYYAIITHMDEQIGRILDGLEASGKSDNTYIFFTADHGLAVGHHGLLGKQNLYDHSVRVPFIVSGPGIESGATRDGWIYLQDVMPTTLELAGVPKPEHVKFKSVLPLVTGKRKENYDALYGAYLAVQRSVTVGNYRLILYPKIGKTLLYDLQNDPHEMSDLSESPKQQKRIKRLFSKLLELQEETGDKLDLRETYAGLL